MSLERLCKDLVSYVQEVDWPLVVQFVLCPTFVQKCYRATIHAFGKNFHEDSLLDHGYEVSFDKILVLSIKLGNKSI